MKLYSDVHCLVLHVIFLQHVKYLDFLATVLIWDVLGVIKNLLGAFVLEF